MPRGFFWFVGIAILTAILLPYAPVKYALFGVFGWMFLSFYKSAPERTLFLFLLGMLAQRALPLATRAPKWVGFAACAIALAMVAFLPMTKINGEIGRWIIYFGLAAATPFIFTAFRNQAWDRWIGDLSYPIYLSHLIVIGVVLTFNLPLPVWTAIGGTLALSIALYLAVDRPVDRWRQVRARKQSAPISMEAVQPA